PRPAVRDAATAARLAVRRHAQRGDLRARPRLRRRGLRQRVRERAVVGDRLRAYRKPAAEHGGTRAEQRGRRARRAAVAARLTSYCIFISTFTRVASDLASRSTERYVPSRSSINRLLFEKPTILPHAFGIVATDLASRASAGDTDHRCSHGVAAMATRAIAMTVSTALAYASSFMRPPGLGFYARCARSARLTTARKRVAAPCSMSSIGVNSSSQ